MIMIMCSLHSLFSEPIGYLQLLCNVDGDDVAQQPVGLVPHGPDLAAMLVGLHVAVVMQAVADLELAVEEPDEEEEEEEGQDCLLEQDVHRGQLRLCDERTVEMIGAHG